MYALRPGLRQDQSLNIWDQRNLPVPALPSAANRNRTIRGRLFSVRTNDITHCPVGALHEQDDTEKLWRALADPNKTVVVTGGSLLSVPHGAEGLSFTGEERLPSEDFLMPCKESGGWLCIWLLFLLRILPLWKTNGAVSPPWKGELKDRPMFTSCCPGWVRFVRANSLTLWISCLPPSHLCRCSAL